MKLWIDDVRECPRSYDVALYTTSAAINFIINHRDDIEEMSLDHDAGDFVSFGGDYINILNWMEQYEELQDYKFKCKILVHSMNPVARQNMERIIKKRGWC